MWVTKFEKLILLLIPNFFLRKILPLLKRYHFIKNTSETQTPISFDLFYKQKVLGHCSFAYWPVHQTSTVLNATNIYCGIDTNPGYSPSNYIQANGKIFIGDYTQIGPNVGLISSNHNPFSNNEHIIGSIEIGKYCWIGMGAIILPNVKLGDFTIVGAGSIVTKSFENGYCVIAGNPAQKIKELNREDCIPFENRNKYNGYIRADEFENFRKKHLKI